MDQTAVPHRQRTQSVQSQLPPKTAILLTSPSAIRYFTGFVCLVPSERDALLLISTKHTYLIHSSFSPLPSDTSWFVRYAGTNPTSLAKHLADIVRKENFQTLFIDAETMTVQEYLVLQELQLHTNNLSETELQTFLQKQRYLKDATEVVCMRKAGDITIRAVEKVLKDLKPGMTERDVKICLEQAMESAGATDMAFPSIIAFGTNSALPHHQPSTKKLEVDMPVLIDVGAQVDGYCADMTRTNWFGPNPSAKFTKIALIVKNAYQAAVSVIDSFATKPEPTLLRTVDSAARTVISTAGYGEQFNHTTGHGLGLEIHEQPSVNWKSQVPLQPQLVITVEPGIYLAGEFGYRYENTVLVSQTSCEELTRLESG